jgi:FtsH-binding integral membrane protein
MYLDLDAQRAWVQRVYAWMVGGLLTTGLTAFGIASVPALQAAIFGSPLIYVFMFLPLGMVLFLSARIEHMKASTAMGTFIAYAMANGVAFSTIFLAYEMGSIASTFFIAAGMYAAAAIYGYTTRRDLSSMGSFMVMGVFGLLIAMVVNWFLGSTIVELGISILGVIIFTGLTMWDMQRIKEEYVLEGHGSAIAAKGAVMGALRLYLNFVNLFLFLLRLLGSRR